MGLYNVRDRGGGANLQNVTAAHEGYWAVSSAVIT